MRPLPAFEELVKSYPNQATSDVFRSIGGKVEANRFPNSCVIRVSRALNYAGHPIRRVAGTLVVSGADGKWYAMRVEEFIGYMSHEYGPPSVRVNAANAEGPTAREAFLGKRGIIAFRVKGWSDASGHFDLWDRVRCIHQDYFARANEAMLWRTPS